MDLRQLLQGKIFSVIINQSFLSIGSIAIVVLLARFTDQVDFGNIRYLIAILAIFSFWSLPGISQIINHRVASMTRSDLMSLVATQGLWGLGALAGAIVIASFHLFNGQQELAFAFIIGGLLAPVANLYLVPGIILAGIHKFGVKILIDTFVIGSAIAGVLYGSIILGSISGIIGAYLGFQSIATIIAFIFVIKFLPKERDFKASESHMENISYGRQLTSLQVPFLLLPAIEKTIVYFVLGPTALALFVIAVLPIEHFKNAFKNLMQFYMLPHLNLDSAQRLLNWILIASTVVFIGIIALILSIIYIMPILFVDFDQVRNISLLLTIAILPLPAYILTIFWIAQRKIKTLWIYALIAIISNIVIFVSITFFYGLTGVVVAKILTEVLIAIGLIILNNTSKASVKDHDLVKVD